MYACYFMRFEPLLLPDLVDGLKKNKFTYAESIEISSFLERAFVRLEAWFQWFQTTQSGNNIFYSPTIPVLFIFILS